MHPLDRKLIRDLLGMKGQILAISLVIACGVATFVMSLSTLESLQYTQSTYYDRYRFAQIFAQLKRAPNTLADRIAELPGVSQIQTRVVVDVTLDVPGLPEPAVGRLISIPDYRRPILNDLYLRSGRYPEPGRRAEVLVSEAFADAHGFRAGDFVQAIINGRWQRLNIVGIALSPEYIFQIRAGDMLPDDLRFGVFWMGETELAAAYDMEGAFNNVTLTMMHGAVEEEIITRLDRLIEPYGGIGAHGREDQVSHRYVTEEITQLRAMGIVAPTIFLSVAAFLLNVVLSRIINTQREQIAALKAFGYTRREIGIHYFKLVLVIVLFGVLLGTVAGLWLGRDLTRLYTRFYRFPIFTFRVDAAVLLLGFGISLMAALLGTMRSVARAVKLPAAEAMRPEPPAAFRPTVIERIGLQRLFSQGTRMILRKLEREPLKAALSSFGIALAVAILVLGNFTADAMDYLIEFQFHIQQRQDVSITLIEPTTGRVLHEIEQLPGVLSAEPSRSIPVRLRFEHRHRRTGIQGLVPDARLYRLIDHEEHPVELPPEGLILSDKLAELLGVGEGDEVIVEVLEGIRPVRRIPVAGLVSEFAGTNAYMDLRAVNRLMREGPAITGAFLMVDDRDADALYATIKQTPRISNVTIKEAALKSFEETIAENLLRMKAVNVVFASIIAFGVVYNTARISLSERSRELATLRVIGFTRAEISAILLGELAVLTLVAIPLGLVIGYGFAAMTTRALETELYRIPLIVHPSTFAFAAVVVMLASLFSGLVVRRRLDQLDLVSVLKSKE